MLKERLVISSVNYITGSQTLLLPLSKIPLLKCRLQLYQLNQSVWGGKQALVIFPVLPSDSNVQ